MNQEPTFDNKAFEAQKAPQEIWAEYEALGSCEYEVQRYSSSLQRLVISVTPLDANGSPQNNRRQFLLFEGVSFMQLLPFWKEEPLRWASPEQQQYFFNATELASHKHYLPQLVHAKVGRLELYVAFVSLDFCKSMPQMTGEYKL